MVDCSRLIGSPVLLCWSAVSYFIVFFLFDCLSGVLLIAFISLAGGFKLIISIRFLGWFPFDCFHFIGFVLCVCFILFGWFRLTAFNLSVLLLCLFICWAGSI